MSLSRVRQLWVAGQRRLRDTYADAREDIHRSLRYWQFAGVLVLLYLLVVVVLAIYWSRAPAVFDVPTAVEQRLAGAEPQKGAALTVTLIEVADTLLEKPGGYLSNDITLPGIWLDNIPSWEYGVLEQVRDLSRSLRENFYGAVPGALDDKDLTLAQSRFHFNHKSWIMPASESQYREGIAFTEAYLQRLLEDPDAHFVARVENLDRWLLKVSRRLDSLSHRLSASVGPVSLHLDGEEVLLPETPWLELDNVFFEARGATWALLHFLRAAELDFADLLRNKNAQQALHQLIRELELSQKPMRSPLILNGRGFGVLPNHSLVMASYIARANSILTDLRRQLAADGRVPIH